MRPRHISGCHYFRGYGRSLLQHSSEVLQGELLPGKHQLTLLGNTRLAQFRRWAQFLTVLVGRIIRDQLLSL